MWINIVSSGVDPESQYLEQLLMRCINGISLVLIMYLLIDSFLFSSINRLEDYIVNPSVIFILSFFICLNRLGKQRISRLLFQFINPIVLGLVLCTFGIGRNGVEIFFIPNLALAFLDVNLKNHQNKIIIWNILCFLLSLSYLYFFGPFNTIPPTIQETYCLTLTAIVLSVSLFKVSINATHNYVNTIQKLSKKLTEQNADLKNFTYAASHDLKTPIRAIIGFNSLIKREVRKYDNKDLDEFLSHSINSAKQMNEVLQDLLKYAVVGNEVAENSPEKVVLKPIIDQVITELSYNEQLKKGVIEIDGKLHDVLGVKSQLKLVLQNLIHNGLIYNNSEEAKITISSTELNDKIVIRVKDNGIGISKEFHKKIFEPFKRLHTKETYEGTGFGLAICNRIVENMNGKIELESQEGEGSTFSIYLQKVVTN